MVLIEGIYCEFKSCYSFIVLRFFLSFFFYVMSASGLGITILLAVGFNPFYSRSHPV